MYIYIYIYDIGMYIFIYMFHDHICKKNGQYICRCIHAHAFLVMQARKVNYTVAFWLIPGVFLNCSFNVCTQNII